MIFLFLTLTLISYIPHLNGLYKQRNQTQVGPNDSNSQLWLKFVKENVPEANTILFFKPRVIYLYTHHKSICPRKQASVEQIESLIINYNVKCVIYDKRFSNKNIKITMLKNDKLWQLIYNGQDVQIFLKSNTEI